MADKKELGLSGEAAKYQSEIEEEVNAVLHELKENGFGWSQAVIAMEEAVNKEERIDNIRVFLRKKLEDLT